MEKKIRQLILAYMYFGIPSINEKMADELTDILKKEVDLREICHFFYHIGAADGIVSGFAGKKTEFEKRYNDFKHELKNE